MLPFGVTQCHSKLWDSSSAKRVFLYLTPGQIILLVPTLCVGMQLCQQGLPRRAWEPVDWFATTCSAIRPEQTADIKNRARRGFLCLATGQII